MDIHNTNLALQLIPASVPPRRGAEMSAILCRMALGKQATSVARKLGRSEDLVRGWARGDSSPSLAQILAAISEPLAQAATKAVRAGWSLTSVGLLDAGAERPGTAYRLGLLEEAGLHIHKIFWGQTPANHEEAA